MKKQIRATIIATITTIVIILSCAFALPVYAEVSDRDEFYPRLAVVVEKEQIKNNGWWIIYCQDKEGIVWAFYDDEGDWDVGDVANLLMWNMSEREEEHEIVDVYWEGYTENPEEFFSLEGWR